MTSQPHYSDIPHRLDRLPWSRWHTTIVLALGCTWLLDGLEVTIVGALGPMLKRPGTLNLSDDQIGLTATAYLLGTVIGAAIFAYLTDRQGRKKWFLTTVVVYLTATVLTAFSWNLESFLFFRFVTGLGIGGEYAAINSAIDELIPARRRGQVDITINGTWWVGTAIGALLTIPLLDPEMFAEDLGWRISFLTGALLALAVVLIRRYVPESPRWLITQNRTGEAEAIVADVERRVMLDRNMTELPVPTGTMAVHATQKVTLGVLTRELAHTYPKRSVLGLTLMVSQSFLYNAIFFTYALVLSKFFQVPEKDIGWYILPFAVGNFLGPLLLGRLFDTVGRKPMLCCCYGLSGVLLMFSGWLFVQGVLDATTQTALWSLIFFFASAGASAAYLTVSEIFPAEIRAMAIAFFFVIAQGAGALAPWVFGHLIRDSSQSLFHGYLVGGGFMIVGAVVAYFLGVKAEGRALEEIAVPLVSRASRT